MGVNPPSPGLASNMVCSDISVVINPFRFPEVKYLRGGVVTAVGQENHVKARSDTPLKRFISASMNCTSSSYVLARDLATVDHLWALDRRP